MAMINGQTPLPWNSKLLVVFEMDLIPTQEKADDREQHYSSIDKVVP